MKSPDLAIIHPVSIANNSNPDPGEVPHVLKTIVDDLLDLLGQKVQPLLHTASEIQHEAHVQGLDLQGSWNQP